jgi:hypothetical protein
VEFTWTAEQNRPAAARVQVERFNDRVLFAEAEATLRGPNWSADNRFVGDFSGTGFLLDDYRAGPAVGQIAVPAAGTYEVWVRSYRRARDDTHVLLDFGRGAVELARPDAARLDEWVWESLGRHDFAAGSATVTLTKDYGTASHMGIFVDALYLSRDEGFDPARQGLWDVVADSGPLDLAASPSASFRWEAPATSDRYRWRVQLLDGERLVDALGRVGIWTPPQEFRVKS